jgi:hypothetical protein
MKHEPIIIYALKFIQVQLRKLFSLSMKQVQVEKQNK